MTREPFPVGQPPGTAMANISRRIVTLHKQYGGRGATEARTDLHGDVVLVLMRGGFTRVEETLLAEGHRDVIARQRHLFHEVMHDRFIEVIEDELGRRVLAFMSANHADPYLLAEIFVLEPEDSPGG